MAAYYNEIDPYAAEWLRNLIAANLIAPGDVDERSIKDVSADDLKGYEQCHFFAGIGGWSVALRQAGWPDDRPVWTGSCPCQPFSGAGLRKGFEDSRHLWPDFLRLIALGRPAILFGEQVARASKWIELVRSDLVSLGYAVGAMPIEAASAGAPHLRDRLWFVADAVCERTKREPGNYLSKKYPSESARGKGWNGYDPISEGQADQWVDCHRKKRPVEPGVQLLVDEFPQRVDLQRAIGNAIVPQVAAEFIQAASEAITVYDLV